MPANSGLDRSARQRVSVYPNIESLPSSYPALFAEAAAAGGFFFSLPWFSHLAAETLQDQHLRIYAIDSDAQAATPNLVLLMCHAISQPKLLGMRRLNAAANFYTSLFGPLTTQTDAGLQASLALLVREIAAELPRWHIVDIHPMAVEVPAYAMTVQAFRQAGFAVQPYFCFGNWYLDVAGRTYREYCATLPSKLKNTLARKTRQLAKSHKLDIRILASQAEVPQSIAAFQAVYRSSWKPAEAFPDFMSGLIELCARQGWLRMGVAYIDGVPAAAQLWIVSHGSAAIYKLAYDERFSTFSVGTILTARLMEHAIDIDRVHTVDYLTGDDAYKQDWMSHRRERWGIAAFNPRTLHGLLGAARHIGGHALKKLWRSRH